MKLSFKYFPKLSNNQLEIIEELSYHTTKLYNIANYDCRETVFKPYVEMNKIYSNNYHKQFLHSHTYQQCLKILEQNWKSYFASIKDYKKNPSKYLGVPRQPKYKNTDNRKNEVVFTDFAIRYQEGILKLSLSKEMFNKFKVKSLDFDLRKVNLPINLDKIKQIKIMWNNSSKQWCLNIIWEREEVNISNDYNNIMSIDLGLDNLATLTFKDNEYSYIIDGKHIKSKNSYYNKEIARLTSIGMKQCKNAKYFKRTKQLIKLQTKRNNFITDYIHKASKKIIDLAIINQCKSIIIGDFKEVKQENKAKSFVQIPQRQLVEKIKYKAELLGIEVIMQEESYTSGCSSLDLEVVSKKYYNKSRRIQRGLFKSNTGKLINADVNGSLNIMRKYFNKKEIECTPKLIELVMDIGLLNNPIRLRVA